DGAVRTWERVRSTSATDVDANLALASLFERQSRESSTADIRATRLASSDQAIDRVLGNDSATRAQRAEALALKGRNQKTHWRETWSIAGDEKERRRGAISRALIDSYESYLAAFHEDLNHFWPGLVAVQMGTILLDLSSENNWNSAFNDNQAAKNYHDELEL